jgi:hypothetical protein
MWSWGVEEVREKKEGSGRGGGIYTLAVTECEEGTTSGVSVTSFDPSTKREGTGPGDRAGTWVYSHMYIQTCMYVHS